MTDQDRDGNRGEDFARADAPAHVAASKPVLAWLTLASVSPVMEMGDGILFGLV